MSILNTKVSWFKTTRKTEVQPPFPIDSFLKAIKGGNLKDKIGRLRNGERDIKKELPTIAFHGQFEYSRKAENFSYTRH